MTPLKNQLSILHCQLSTFLPSVVEALFRMYVPIDFNSRLGRVAEFFKVGDSHSDVGQEHISHVAAEALATNNSHHNALL